AGTAGRADAGRRPTPSTASCGPTWAARSACVSGTRRPAWGRPVTDHLHPASDIPGEGLTPDRDTLARDLLTLPALVEAPEEVVRGLVLRNPWGSVYPVRAVDLGAW